MKSVFKALLFNVGEEAYEAALHLRRYSRFQELKAPDDILIREQEIIQERFSNVSEARTKLASIVLRTENATRMQAGEILARHLPHEFLPAPYEKEFLIAIGSTNNGHTKIGEWHVVLLTEDASEDTRSHEFAHVALEHGRGPRSDVKRLKQEVAASLLAKKWLEEKNQWSRELAAQLEKGLKVLFARIQPCQSTRMRTWFESRICELRGETLAARKLMKSLFPEKYLSREVKK